MRSGVDRIRLIVVVGCIVLGAVGVLVVPPGARAFVVVAVAVALAYSRRLAVRLCDRAKVRETLRRRRQVAEERRQYRGAHPAKVADAARGFARATESYAIGRWEIAQAELRAALDEDPYHHRARLLLGRILFDHQNKRVEAFAEFERAIESEPSDPETHATRLVYTIKVGRHDEAVEHARREVVLRSIESEPAMTMSEPDLNGLLSAAYLARGVHRLGMARMLAAIDPADDMRAAKRVEARIKDERTAAGVRERLLKLGFGAAVLDTVYSDPIATQPLIPATVAAGTPPASHDRRDKWRAVLDSAFLAHGVDGVSPLVSSEFRAERDAAVAELSTLTVDYDDGDGDGDGA